jgi:hypothetical protein
MFDHLVVGERRVVISGLLESSNLRELMRSREVVDLMTVIVSLTCEYP